MKNPIELGYIGVNATRGEDFACFSNLSLYGSLMVGTKGPKFVDYTAKVIAEAERYRAEGYEIQITNMALTFDDVEMLAECGAL